MAFSLLGNKIGGINDITANHQCAFKPGYGTFAEKPAYQPPVSYTHLTLPTTPYV